MKVYTTFSQIKTLIFENNNKIELLYKIFGEQINDFEESTYLQLNDSQNALFSSLKRYFTRIKDFLKHVSERNCL